MKDLEAFVCKEINKSKERTKRARDEECSDESGFEGGNDVVQNVHEVKQSQIKMNREFSSSIPASCAKVDCNLEAKANSTFCTVHTFIEKS